MLGIYTINVVSPTGLMKLNINLIAGPTYAAVPPLLGIPNYRSYIVSRAARPCVYRKLDSAILVVKAIENWV
jgi:hypothetical protein